MLLVRVSACLDDVFCVEMGINQGFYERGIRLEIADMNYLGSKATTVYLQPQLC